MNLDLGIVVEAARTTGRSDSASGTPEASSRFSSLLARHLDNPGGSSPQPESGEPAERAGRVRSDESGEPGTDRWQSRDEVREGRSSGPPDPANRGTENGGVGIRDEQSPILSSLESWQSLAWQLGPHDSHLPAQGVATVGTVAGERTVPIQSRLAGEIAARFSDRGGVQTLSLKLTPEHLGKVEVQLQAKGDHLNVRITAGSREAESALRENLRDLTDAIQEKTGRYQQVDVRVNLKTGGDDQQPGADKDTTKQGQDHRRQNETDKGGNPDPDEDSGRRGSENESDHRAREG